MIELAYLKTHSSSEINIGYVTKKC